ncbi:MAG TPA: ribonuclease III, partial [Candidatus Eisenbacteria bacterium]|nr:ribonuclease III [Candidatus Eisenbacteria bacterium]
MLDRLRALIAPAPAAPPSLSEQEARALAEFQKHFGITFHDPELLKLALTHRSYLSVTGQGPRESNERLEFLGDSVLGLVTSEFLYRSHPNEHEGQLTKTKSLLVSKAILSRRALAMGLGRFVLMSHSEVESGGRQRLSILADAFESVLGAVYLDQGFEPARQFVEHHLLRDTREITQDKRHTNYKSHLQEYVQSTWRTHPVYRIRSEIGPDHSKHFLVEVLVGKRVLGEGRGRNKKEAEQAAARDALEGARPERPARDAA